MNAQMKPPTHGPGGDRTGVPVLPILVGAILLAAAGWWWFLT